MTGHSPLRAARLRRNWTLARVVRELEEMVGAPTGATESLVSAWERGRIRPSLHYRELLCRLYGSSADELGFLERAKVEGVRLLTSYDELVTAMLAVVEDATEVLVTTGSRSREREYLAAIERALADRPDLVHHRVLFGPPRSEVLRDHLMRLFQVRDPTNLERGVKTFSIAVVEDLAAEPERFICASERRAVVAVPSLVTPGNFDTGILVDAPDRALAFAAHGKQVALGARRIDNVQAVLGLPLVA